VSLEALQLTAEQLAALRRAFPEVAQRFPVQSERALEWLAQEDAWRRGAKDPVSGAQHRLGLLQGALLKEDFDVGLHAEGWKLGALLVDLERFTLFNQAHGFGEGDRALAAVVVALREAFRGARVVRIHADAFAVLMGPTSDAQLSAQSESIARAALKQATAAWAPALEFTVATLELTVVAPSHHEVIGPLVWAECERALMAKKRVPASGASVRTLVLDALVNDPR
jgi:GGDEF domain-containing protein